MVFPVLAGRDKAGAGAPTLAVAQADRDRTNVLPPIAVRPVAARNARRLRLRCDMAPPWVGDHDPIGHDPILSRASITAPSLKICGSTMGSPAARPDAAGG